MLIKTNKSGFIHPLASEVTSQGVYQERRQLIRLMAGGVAGAALGSMAMREAHAQSAGKLAA